MSEPKHSPGPWRLGDEGEDAECDTPIHSDSWMSLAQVVTKIAGNDSCDEAGLANAHLIAAAPELLEVCEAAFSFCYRLPSELADQLEAAIAKAKGYP